MWEWLKHSHINMKYSKGQHYKKNVKCSNFYSFTLKCTEEGKAWISRLDINFQTLWQVELISVMKPDAVALSHVLRNYDKCYQKSIQSITLTHLVKSCRCLVSGSEHSWAELEKGKFSLEIISYWYWHQPASSQAETNQEKLN